MYLTFGSHFQLLKRIKLTELHKQFPGFNCNNSNYVAPYDGVQEGFVSDIISFQDEKDKYVEQILKNNKILYIKASSESYYAGHFIRRNVPNPYEYARSYVETHKKAVPYPSDLAKIQQTERQLDRLIAPVEALRNWISKTQKS